MSKSQLLPLVVVAMLASGYWLLTPGQAQPAGPAAPAAGHCLVAVVDVPMLFREGLEMKKLNDDLQKRLEQVKLDADARQTTLMTNLAKLEKEFTPGSKDYEARLRELSRDRNHLHNDTDDARDDILREEQTRGQFYYDKIRRVVEGIAAADGFEIVLFKDEPDFKHARNSDEMKSMIAARKVVFNTPRCDITKEALDKLDADFTGAKPKAN